MRPGERELVLAQAGVMTRRLKGLGFTFVALDGVGHRSGSMNEAFDL